MSPLENTQRTQFTVPIECHWCGHAGSSIWEDTAGGRQIVSLDGFYERMAKKPPYGIETVCNSCDRAQSL